MQMENLLFLRSLNQKELFYYGDVSSHLANLVVKKLGVKARSEKPGLCGRASVALQSPVDREEARQAGTVALRSAVEGNSGVMVGFERVPGTVYQMKTKLCSYQRSYAL